MRYTLEIDQHGDHVHLDVSAIPVALRLALAQALAGDDLDLAKAQKPDDGEGLDPRFPELGNLLARMASIWRRWTDWLISRTVKVVKRKGATPAERTKEISTLLREHEAGVTATITGAAPHPEITYEMVRRGDIPPTYAMTAPIPVAVRHGFEENPTTPRGVPDVMPTDPPLRPLHGKESMAIRYATDRAAIFMKRPIASMQASMQHVLLEHDHGRVGALGTEEAVHMRSVIAQGIEEGVSAKDLARRLRDAATGTTLTNDMMRVAVTELHFAHGHGAWVALAAKTVGSDPLVYRIASPNACDDCRRLFGVPGAYQTYRMSEVQAAGSNIGVKRGSWKATVGPAHPRCQCSPWVLYNPTMTEVIFGAAQNMAQ